MVEFDSKYYVKIPLIEIWQWIPFLDNVQSSVKDIYPLDSCIKVYKSGNKGKNVINFEKYNSIAQIIWYNFN